MTGNVAPDTVKPAPVSVAELMVTGAVPVEVNVTGCVDAVFTVTLPNVRLAALIVNCGLGTPCPARARAAQIDNRCAVGRRVALDRQLTRRRSRGGRIELHIQRHRLVRIQGDRQRGSRHREASTRQCCRVDGHRRRPRGGQRQGCVDAVFTVTLPNVRLAALIVNCGLDTAVPVRRARAAQINNRRAVGRRVALDRSADPLPRPCAVGSNCTFSVTDWLGFNVTGNVAPDIVKPVPVSAAELIVTGAVPVEVNVTGWVDAVFTVTLPNVRLAALTVSPGVELCR